MFENLEVYQKAVNLADQVAAVSLLTARTCGSSTARKRLV